MKSTPQAGAIAVDLRHGSPRFLLVQAKNSPAHWIFPKGHIEPGESRERTALRELAEEAGITGRVLDLIGSTQFRSGDEEVDVDYYLVEADGETPPSEVRAREWLEYALARERLSFPDAKRLLDRALESLRRRKL